MWLELRSAKVVAITAENVAYAQRVDKKHRPRNFAIAILSLLRLNTCALIRSSPEWNFNIRDIVILIGYSLRYCFIDQFISVVGVHITLFND